jgi:hypothetical protein
MMLKTMMVVAALVPALAAAEVTVGYGVGHQYSLKYDGLWTQQGTVDHERYTVKTASVAVETAHWRLGYRQFGGTANTGGTWLSDDDYKARAVRNTTNQVGVDVFGRLRWVSLERRVGVFGLGALYYDRRDTLVARDCTAACITGERKGGLRPMLSAEYAAGHLGARVEVTGNTKTKDGATGGSGGAVNLRRPGNFVFELNWRF